MSWTTLVFWGMSWGLRQCVVGHRDVVETCRVEHTFSGGCRGDGGSVSWITGMSWKHVVGHVDVVGACRGTQTGRGSVSWDTGDVVEVPLDRQGK